MNLPELRMKIRTRFYHAWRWIGIKAFHFFAVTEFNQPTSQQIIATTFSWNPSYNEIISRVVCLEDGTFAWNADAMHISELAFFADQYKKRKKLEGQKGKNENNQSN